MEGGMEVGRVEVGVGEVGVGGGGGGGRWGWGKVGVGGGGGGGRWGWGGGGGGGGCTWEGALVNNTGSSLFEVFAGIYIPLNTLMMYLQCTYSY